MMPMPCVVSLTFHMEPGTATAFGTEVGFVRPSLGRSPSRKTTSLQPVHAFRACRFLGMPSFVYIQSTSKLLDIPSRPQSANNKSIPAQRLSILSRVGAHAHPPQHHDEEGNEDGGGDWQHGRHRDLDSAVHTLTALPPLLKRHHKLRQFDRSSQNQ